MLEHNSDRMYWVIGAILIGALLVGLAYGLFQGQFKNVGRMLTNMIKKADDKVSGVGTIAPFLHL